MAKRQIIGRRFEHRGQPHIKLSKVQASTRIVIKEKINNGTYLLVESPCLCGSCNDIIISETDRYGLPLNTVICEDCGLVRMEPRLDGRSLEDFYQKEYRDLYMGPEYGDMKTYFDTMVGRGREIFSLLGRELQMEFKGMDVLEIGCSVGGILIPFIEAGSNVTGYDYDRRYLDYGNRCNQLLHLNFGGLDNIKNDDRQYDLILINHVLEHLSDPEAAVKIIKKSLKPDGVLYVSVPGLTNSKYYFSPTKSFLGSLHIAHLYHFTPQSLVRLMKGFRAVYIDDEISSIFRIDSAEKIDKQEQAVSEFCSTLEYIKRHERSYERKLCGLKMFVRNLLKNNN